MKKTRAWKNMAVLFVFWFVNETFSPSVVSSTPGLRVKKSAAGMATRWAVRFESMLMYAHIIFSEIEKVKERSTSHHLLVKTVVIDSSPDMFPDVVKTILIPPALFFVFP